MRSQRSRNILTAFALALALGSTGCASAGGAAGAGGGGPNLIVEEELAPLQQLDAYQAIQRLRSRWLVSRGGSSPTLFVNGARRGGGLGDLRTLRAADVAEMQFLSASDATTRFGTNMDGGAILVTLKR
jgi:hypothetical protein